MTKSIFLFLLGILSLSAMAQPKLSEEARISLMTSAPYDEEVFTVYGHAALRIYDPKQNIDYIFNYGIFDFSKPNFIYRFAKGETDYKLGVADFQDYVIEYQMRGSDITEQVLNLTQEEKEHIWDALLINYRPENRVYRYNFFFDNCATRPAAILEKEINGSVDYQYPYQSQTFRDLINYCTRNHPWLTFGCDLALGSPTDREATPIRPSRRGRTAGAQQLDRKMRESAARIKSAPCRERLRPLVAEALRRSVDERDFRSRLAKEQIDLVLRRNGTGRIYGVTFIDHRSRTVLNGSRLGKEFSANTLDRCFQERPQDLLPPLLPSVPSAVVSGNGEKILGGLLSGMEPELNYVPRHPRLLKPDKKKRRRRYGRQD